jgi:predicted alpha-1,2-mannosidase
MVRPFHFVHRIVLPAGLLFLGLSTIRPEPAASVPAPAAAMRPVSAADPCFRYEGRFDRADAAGPVVVWQASRIRIDFTGDQLAFRFDGLEGQNFFDLHVDDAQAILAVPAGTGQRIACPLSLTGGRHRLLLFKRSEASAGTARFKGIEIAPGADVAAPAAPGCRLAMEFVGDSITAGACNEDDATDQWEDRRTHNNALSYGAMTAAAFGADYRCTAVSGMGVAIGWSPFRAAQLWDRVYPNPSSHRADLTAWTPDVVFVNLGENDDSFTRAKKMPFPADFSAGYVALVRAIRAAHPAASIVLLRGGMYGGANSAELRKAWEAAVAELEAADPHIAHFVFQHWSSNHPRVSDHRALADELIAWLRLQPFMLAAVPGLSAGVPGLVDLVDMRMGCLNGSNCVIGPQLPHGSVNPSPQTPNGGMGGYKPGEPVRGFGQLHVTGTGWSKYGQFLISPQTGLQVGEQDHDSPISEEVATPAGYSVRLDRYGIKVELAPAHNAVIYRFTFPESADAHLLLDIAHSLPMDIAPEMGGRFLGCEARIDPRTGAMEGGASYIGGFGGMKPYSLYFYALPDRAPDSVGAWCDGVVSRGATEIRGGGRRGAFLGYKTAAGAVISLKIGVSVTSVANARRFAETQIPSFDFEAVHRRAAATWEDVLGRVRIEGATPDQRRLFYTCLYQSFLMPRDRSNDTPFIGSTAPYWDDQFAVWDTWRTKFPLMVLLDDAMVRSNIQAFAERLMHNSVLADAFVAGNDGETQGGDDLDNIIVDAFVKKVPGVDWNAAFAVIENDAEHQRYPEFRRLGWIPDDSEDAIMTCSNTLECAYNDYLAATMAGALGRAGLHDRWLARSARWENLWDPGTVSDGFAGFIRPRRSNGDWVAFDPKKNYGSWKSYFYEAASWTYSTFVPHNLARLIELSGGDARFVERIDHALSSDLMELANEPSFLATRAFSYARRPDRTSCWTHKVMDGLYGLDKGYPGNEDSGAMASWYVFSSLGFFPNAGQPVYLLNGPLFRRSETTFSNGARLVIEAEGVSVENIYIQSATLDGADWRKNWISHDDIRNGGTLRLVMGPAPSAWGVNAEPPPSLR